MKPSPFDYAVPATLVECLELLSDESRDIRVLAGGQSLMPMLNLRLAHPDLLVDINRIPELTAYSIRPSGLAVSATARMADLESDPAVATASPLVAEALTLIGHRAIRSRGTVCGSIAHADPAAELPAVAVALDAEVVLISAAGERRLAATEFIQGPLITAIAATELIREVLFPAWRPGSGWAIAEFSRRHGDFAVGGAIAILSVEGGVVTSASVTAFGLAGRAQRLPVLESTLVGAVASPALAATAEQQTLEQVEVWDGAGASGQYRRRLASGLVGRALRQALGRVA